MSIFAKMAGGLALAALLTLAPVAASAADLTVVAPDGASKVLTEADLASLPRASVPVGKITYEGPVLAYVLRAGGMPVGAKLHGDPLRAYVTVTGRDGYLIVFSLAELDRELHDDVVILADKADGKPLPEKQAPWRIVTAGDKKPWRSVHSVVKIQARMAQP